VHGGYHRWRQHGHGGVARGCASSLGCSAAAAGAVAIASRQPSHLPVTQSQMQRHDTDKIRRILYRRIRVRVEIMGPGKYENVGKSQSVLIMINYIIFTRTRTQFAHGMSDGWRRCTSSRCVVPPMTSCREARVRWPTCAMSSSTRPSAAPGEGTKACWRQLAIPMMTM
jgi:hypothetical protein